MDVLQYLQISLGASLNLLLEFEAQLCRVIRFTPQVAMVLDIRQVPKSDLHRVHHFCDFGIAHVADCLVQL